MLKEDAALFFKIIFDQTPVSTQVFSPDGMTILVNKAWEKLWRVKAKYVVNSYNVLKDKQLVETGSMKYIKRGFSGEVVTIPAIKYDPSKIAPHIPHPVAYRWLSARMFPIKDKNGRIRQIVLQHEDITQRKEALDALRLSEERLRLALKAGNIGVWDWDIESNNLLWTDNIYTIHGLNKKTFKPTVAAWRTLIHPDEKRTVEEALERTLEKNEPFQVEFRTITPKGQIRWVATSAVLLHSENGTPQRLLGATSNITQQKQLEQDRNDFINMASHELKTPLTSMKMFLGLLKKHAQTRKSDKTVAYVDKLQTQASRLSELISDLLDISRIETGKLQIRKEHVRLDELVSDTVEGMVPLRRKHSIRIDKKTAVTVYADRYRLYQVLTNFLTNAIKYSPSEKEIIVSVKKSKDEAVVSVRDFGIGIKKSQHTKIFNRLYQVTGQKEKTFPGLGLGLYISKEIIRRHGGRIWVESTYGKGSTFYFSLPLSIKQRKKPQKRAT